MMGKLRYMRCRRTCLERWSCVRWQNKMVHLRESSWLLRVMECLVNYVFVRSRFYLMLIDIDRSPYHVWRQRERERSTRDMFRRNHMAWSIAHDSERTFSRCVFDVSNGDATLLLLIIHVWTCPRTSMWHGISWLGECCFVYFFFPTSSSRFYFVDLHKGSIESWTDQWNTIPQVWWFPNLYWTSTSRFRFVDWCSTRRQTRSTSIDHDEFIRWSRSLVQHACQWESALRSTERIVTCRFEKFAQRKVSDFSAVNIAQTRVLLLQFITEES